MFILQVILLHGQSISHANRGPYSNLVWPIFYSIKLYTSFSYRYMPTYSKLKDEAEFEEITDTDAYDPADEK